MRASLRQKLGSDFTMAVSLYYSYDSLPPDPSATDKDWGWVITVGWLF